MEFSPSKGIQVEEEMRTGTYTGDETASRVIDIGFTPKAIWIFPETLILNASAAAIAAHYASNLAGAGWEKNATHFQGIVENGFKTGTDDLGNGTNKLDTIYFWIASP